MPAIGEHQYGRLEFSNSKIYLLHTFFYYVKVLYRFYTSRGDLLVFRIEKKRKCIGRYATQGLNIQVD